MRLPSTYDRETGAMGVGVGGGGVVVPSQGTWMGSPTLADPYQEHWIGPLGVCSKGCCVS